MKNQTQRAWEVLDNYPYSNINHPNHREGKGDAVVSLEDAKDAMLEFADKETTIARQLLAKIYALTDIEKMQDYDHLLITLGRVHKMVATEFPEALREH